MSFFEKNRNQLAEKGIDPVRLPPGQYSTDRFPILHVGDVPTFSNEEWNLTIDGQVEYPYSLGLDDLRAMSNCELVTDIHCVTKWSKFDTRWTGVKVSELLDRAKPSGQASHVMGHAEYGYTANPSIADLRRPESLIVFEYDGQPIEPIHGGPVRLLVPNLYFWKSIKWVRRLEVILNDSPGFWEQNGYHMYGDPFLEQRFSDD